MKNVTVTMEEGTSSRPGSLPLGKERASPDSLRRPSLDVWDGP